MLQMYITDSHMHQNNLDKKYQLIKERAIRDLKYFRNKEEENIRKKEEEEQVLYREKNRQKKLKRDLE